MRISNVYEECGSIIALSLYCMTWGRARNHFYFFIFFSAERAYTPVIFGCALSRLMQTVSVNGARHNNEPAHRHKKYICRKLENQLKLKNNSSLIM